MHASLQQLLVQWRQTPRLRVGVLLMTAVVALYLVLLLADERDQALKDYQEQVVRLNKVQGLSDQQHWLERANQARATRIQFESRLWQAESKGLAQATLQTWFTRNLRSEKLTGLSVDTELATEVPGNARLWQVTADLKGQIKRAQLVNLLKLLETNQQLITVEHLKLSRTRKDLEMQLQLRAWFLGPDADAEDDQ